MTVTKLEPLKLSIRQIAEVTGESIPTIYSAINAGDLQTFLVGRRRFARPEAVRAWVDHLEAQSNAGRPVSYRSREALGDHRGVA
ncbi:helix-turn-helix domain-containing protein [Pseudoxanthomonas taiwanensis]|uniref:DNA-binding protein n=1 Tax=Pseudoxanthomonas taiwanensis TaxID=176598 RepID=A0A921NV03_9GAMM|nr:helix-turn-helix domain-containing protein [Pseudoxanthomonas taiwanensis]KAF1690190.1 DNA-binding protein [Pseudoxanthomonas taiwanensis]